jgi:hypothetical protein
MTQEIRIVQFFDLVTNNEPNKHHCYQNYFVNESKSLGGKTFEFAPFSVSGSSSNLSGDNDQLTILFPAIEYAVKLVEAGEGNRRSLLTLDTRFVTSSGNIGDNGPHEIFIGLGAAFSVDTIELRFSSAIDAVASNFPANSLTEENVGILPLESSLSLR